MKCAHGRRHDHDAGKVTGLTAAVLPVARQQIQDSPPPRSEKRKRKDTETETETEMIVRYESYNRNHNSNDDLDESTGTGKRQRLGSCHGSESARAIIQRVEGLGGLPTNTEPEAAAAPPITITGHLSETSALSGGPRRSQRIRKTLGSACVTTHMS
jgi:hypothetical protein